MIVDMHYRPVQAEGHLWNTHVSHGVYATLFEPFASLNGQTPFGSYSLANSVSIESSRSPDYIHTIVQTTIASRVRSHSKAKIDLHLTV